MSQNRSRLEAGLEHADLSGAFAVAVGEGGSTIEAKVNSFGLFLSVFFPFFLSFFHYFSILSEQQVYIAIYLHIGA